MGKWTHENCCYTEGVGCDKAYTHHCDNCGFRPAVHRASAAKVREQLKNEGKMSRKFAYPARLDTAEEVDNVQGTD